MLRREIFNIFLGAVQNKPLSDQKAAVIEMPAHLSTEQTEAYVQEFHQHPAATQVPLEVSPLHAFSITWAPNNEAAAAAFDLLLENETAHPERELRFGMQPEGFLYIGDVVDQRKLEHLADGLIMKLEVTPQANDILHARLVLTDQGGLTLAMLKTTKYNAQYWQGQLSNPEQGLRSLKIEGRIVNK